jgi:type IV secretory pathway TraG/TraD family ATPase VirD4
LTPYKLHSHAKTSTTDSNIARNLLNPDEIRRLKENEVIFVRGNKEPAKLNTIPSYKQKKLKGFLNYSKKNKPEIKNDDVYESTDFPINRFLDEAKKMLEDNE